MPKLAISPTFLSEFSRLDQGIQTAALTAVEAYMSGDDARIEPLADAADSRVRLLRVGQQWSGVVAPGAEDSEWLITIRPRDEAVAFAHELPAPPAGPGIELIEPGPGTEPDADAPALSPLPRITGPEELSADLTRSFADWQITLHPRQHRIVDAHFAGSAQITGGPGTGKTVLALHRAAHLAQRDAARHPGDGRRTILLTTFNRLLAQTLSQQLDRILPDRELRSRVDVATVDSLARSLVQEHTGRSPQTLGRATISERWRDAARAEGLPYSGRFLVDEWEQVVLAQNITRLSDYVRCERSGRVLHLAPEYRAHVWEAVQRYTGAMEVADEWSYPKVALEAARALARTGPRYRHVVVDEAQDLHPAQWRMLRAAVPAGADDLFIVGDPHQRIYDNRVSLASLGVNVRGRSHRLRVSYRVTQEILDWALPILGRHSALGMDDNADTLAGYRSLLHGPAPVIRGCASRTEERAAMGEWVRVWLEAGASPASIAVAGRNQWIVRHIDKELQARGIPTAPLDAAEQVGAVRVGTMHKLKGQEFRCLAIMGMSEPLLPPKAAVDSAEGDPVALEQIHQQERNLLFVACTRARDALYVSYTGAPSRLLPHLPGTDVGTDAGGDDGEPAEALFSGV
ncbi:UvrD-helicase domain-containing protein [Streptomonospora litoralis]|uniref:DNA 3'-5' helicase n=1 Tax=Streptomonospora litoralis TaxID=2498135 RepID=A0A4P6Q8A0_9ACTN|nr:UvrD-helicase domain-containing protein [Streptomonospora litoralis]QBI55711.1 Putative ATP-dependent DNA helicase YjcD [Streptomonospora litoralis]